MLFALSVSAVFAITNSATINAAPAANPQSNLQATMTTTGTQTKTTSHVSITKKATPKGTTTTTTTTKKSVTTTKKPIRLKIVVPCRAWVPKNVQPKAVLLCVHGLGLNSESYADFGQQMQQAGIGVFAVDVRGFGTWIKLKGKANCNFKSCITDVTQALQVISSALLSKR